MVRLLSQIKNYLLPDGTQPRKIRSGPFKGIVMNLSLRSQSQIYCGLFEKETHPWLKRLSRRISTAIDIGAAYGEHTLYFLMKTEAAKIYAFEPDNNVLSLLNDNLSLNRQRQSKRLEIVTAFLGDGASGEIQLDSLWDSVQTPCLIKMDVDGAEEGILRGAVKLNATPGIRWLIETHSPELELACLDILKGAGFQTRVIRNAWWRVFIPELRPIRQNRWLAAWKTD